MTVDAVSNVGVFISDCVPENRLSTKNTARLPILKPANDKSGVVTSVIVLLAGSGTGFPSLGFESFIAITATPATDALKGAGGQFSASSFEAQVAPPTTQYRCYFVEPTDIADSSVHSTSP